MSRIAINDLNPTDSQLIDLSLHSTDILNIIGGKKGGKKGEWSFSFGYSEKQGFNGTLTFKF